MIFIICDELGMKLAKVSNIVTIEDSVLLGCEAELLKLGQESLHRDIDGFDS